MNKEMTEREIVSQIFSSTCTSLWHINQSIGFQISIYNNVPSKSYFFISIQYSKVCILCKTFPYTTLTLTISIN